MRRSLIARALAIAAAARLALTACGGGGDPLNSGSGSGRRRPRRRHDRRRLGQLHREPDPRRDLRPGAAGQGRQRHREAVNIGSREAYFPGLQDGSIDLIPEYTGVLLQYLDKSATETEPDAVYAALQKALPDTLTVLDKSSAEDKDAVVVTKDTATKYNATSIADLAATLRAAHVRRAAGVQDPPRRHPGPPEDLQLHVQGLTRSLDAGGPLTVAALKNGDVQAADLFTTDASIVANNFVVLDDPKNNFAAQNVVPLINKAKANDTVKHDAQRDLGEAHHRGAHASSTPRRRRREAEPGDGGEELAVAERPGLITAAPVSPRRRCRRCAALRTGAGGGC